MRGRSDYQAARTGAALAPPWNRRFLEVTGRAPGEMLNGILSNTVPGEPVESTRTGLPAGTLEGRVVYATLLTPKGRMISDLRIFAGSHAGFLLEVPEAGAGGALEQFKKFLPPRLARIRDATEEWSLLTLVGPRSGDLLREVALGRGGTGEPALAEGEELVLSDSPFGFLRITPHGGVAFEAWDLLVEVKGEEELREGFEAGGAEPMSAETLDLLRLERGRPAFGRDMDTETIPMEAGIQDRAIDPGKGCYTGQEVIIRIRDRGQVNKQLRGILLGETPVPEGGTGLFVPGRDRPVGWITSAGVSPAMGETIALGYLKRRVEPGDEVRVGGEEGPPARVRALNAEGWRDEG